jgi:predicted PurR-regulated permease PerM
VFEQVAELPQRLEKYAHTLAGWLTMIWGNLSGTLATPPDTAPAAEAPPPEWTQQLVPLVREHGLAVANTTLQGATHFLSSVFAWLTVFVLIPMYAFFFLLRYDAVVAAIRDHLPANIRPTVVHFARTIDNAMANFFRGRLVVCLIVAVVSGMGWTLVGVPYGLQLGALAGLLNLVPFMSLLALPPVLLLTYLDAQHSPAGWALPMVLAMGVYMAVQALESFALTPMIESRSSGLHPITTVVVLLIGAEWAGLFGMLLAIPVASTLKTLSAELLLPEVRRLAAGQPEPAEAAETAPAASNAPGSEQP